MRHVLEIKDSDNSVGTYEVEISIVGSSVRLELSDPKRVISMNKEELKQVLGMYSKPSV